MLNAMKTTSIDSVNVDDEAIVVLSLLQSVSFQIIATTNYSTFGHRFIAPLNSLFQDQRALATEL